MAVGIPTSVSHDKAMDGLLNEFNSLLVQGEKRARENRIAMAAGVVSDEVIRGVWEYFANAEYRINQIRRTPDFHDAYARFRGLAYSFNCTDDINAAQDKVINLPANHKFKTDHRVDFKISEGALPIGLAEDTNYFVRTVDAANGTLTLTTTEGGGSDININNGTGTAEMLLNIKPDLANLLTAMDAILDEIESSLTQRATTYDRANLGHVYSTRSTVETATLRTTFTDFENLVDIIPA
jgi:hypothetical protein